MRWKRFPALFLCAGLVLLFVWQPGLMSKGLDKRFIKQWIRGETIAYEGYLNIWHVPSKASGTGSGDSYLQGCIEKFQKQNFGVFLRIESMDAQQLANRLAQGERPDMLSFNGGDIAQPQQLFLPLEDVETLLPNLQQAGRVEDELYACPYMQGGAAILVNDDAFYEAGLTPPAGPEYMDAAWLESLGDARESAFAVDENDTSLALNLLASGAELEQPTLQALTFAPSRPARSLFEDGGPMVMLGDISTIFQLESSGDAYAPAYSVFPLSGYTTRLQFMGICQTDNADKQQAAAHFLSFMLGTKQQDMLSGVWGLPVIPTDQSMPDNAILSPFWHFDKGGNLYLLDAFSTEAEQQFAQLREQATADAQLMERAETWANQRVDTLLIE